VSKWGAPQDFIDTALSAYRKGTGGPATGAPSKSGARRERSAAPWRLCSVSMLSPFGVLHGFGRPRWCMASPKRSRRSAPPGGLLRGDWILGLCMSETRPAAAVDDMAARSRCGGLRYGRRCLCSALPPLRQRPSAAIRVCRGSSRTMGPGVGARCTQPVTLRERVRDGLWGKIEPAAWNRYARWMAERDSTHRLSLRTGTRRIASGKPPYNWGLGGETADGGLST